MIKITVVISAYNEEKNIKECLESVRQLADEIILIDNTSTDKTVEIASSMGQKVKIFIRPNNLMLNINKNFGFSKAVNEWILNLDADERATPQLKEEIKRIIGNWKLEIGNSALAVGYWLPRKNIIFGRWIKHGIWWPDHQLRLFKKNKGGFPCKHIHEYLKVEGKTARLENAIIHYNYQSVSQYLYKLDKIYTENEADNIIKAGKKLSWQDALRMPVHDFLKTFFLQEGYKDGLHGLVLSMLQGFYSLVVFAKVWEKQGFKHKQKSNFLREVIFELKKLAKEFKYWLVQSKLKTEENFLKKAIIRIFKMI